MPVRLNKHKIRIICDKNKIENKVGHNLGHITLGAQIIITDIHLGFDINCSLHLFMAQQV